MNAIALPTPEYRSPPAPDLGIGTHIITFAVSDRAGEKEPDFSAIRHAGVTGGASGARPCVIHVFKANILAPNNNQNVSRVNLALKAEAPASWEINEYQDINRLAYRWLLEPLGEPAGRPSVDTPKMGKGNQLQFKATIEPASLTYVFNSTNNQFKGNYRITLQVTDNSDAAIGTHTQSIVVVFNQV